MLVLGCVWQLRAQPTEAGGEALKELPLSMEGLMSLVLISAAHVILQTNLFIPNLTLDVVSTSIVSTEGGKGSEHRLMRGHAYPLRANYCDQVQTV